MLSSFLVSLDESDFDEQILPYASALARSADIALHLAHVHVPYPPTQVMTTQYGWEGVDMWQYDEQDREKEWSYLDETAKRVSEELGKPVTPALLVGEVAAAVEEYVKTHGIGLVVVGAHRHRGLLGLGPEAVEDALVHHTDLPVLIVPAEAGFPTEDGIQRILVPLDISERAQTILQPAVELAQATGAELILLHVMPTMSAVGIPVGHLPGRADIAETYLEGIAEGLRERSIVVHRRVVEQTSPVKAILDVIREERVDLIALTTDGHTGLRRALLGSVSESVLKESHKPVLLERSMA
ncbi:MAG: universal stress protein [Gemmatimonadetes bacterium]|nr:universal stress protein [Gemmatimonadota bacterium]